MTPIERAAAAWHATATETERAAWNLFRDAQCPSCGDKATPGCSCWAVRMPRFVAMVGGEV